MNPRIGIEGRGTNKQMSRRRMGGADSKKLGRGTTKQTTGTLKGAGLKRLPNSCPLVAVHNLVKTLLSERMPLTIVKGG